MKHIILLGDGMADHPVERLQGKTLLQYANTPNLDRLASKGRCGVLRTIPDGFHPGSEVANTSILGYDLHKVYEGRGPLEAASIGYEMRPEDMALRCNIITLSNGKIHNHHGGHLTTEQSDMLVRYLNSHLGSDTVCFITGIQYRHLLVIKGGNKHLIFSPPHDNPDKEWRPLLVKPGIDPDPQPGRLTPEETATLINELILKSQELLSHHPFNQGRKEPANSIWPWGGGYKPDMMTLKDQYSDVQSGAVISAVDLIRGIGHYAGLDIIKVEGATGQYDTNYEGKVEAALNQLRTKDFVFLHIEASDEAGHDGDLDLKLLTIENFDKKVVGPILEAIERENIDVCVAVLPDHPTPVELRTHIDEPVPFAIWHRDITPDRVEKYDEESCKAGAYGTLRLQQFMQEFMKA